MSDTTTPESADELRARAYDLYRRSDNVPMSADNRASIERVGDLREEAEQLMARAAVLYGGTDTTTEKG